MGFGAEKETADNGYSSNVMADDDGAHSGSVSDRCGPIRLEVEDFDASSRPCAACARIGEHVEIRHGWGHAPVVWVPLCPTCYQTLVADGPGSTPGHGPFGRPYYTRERIAELVHDFSRVAFALRANAPTCHLPVDAGGLASRPGADQEGAVDAWLEAGDAPSPRAPRAAGGVDPIPDPGLAEADDRPIADGDLIRKAVARATAIVNECDAVASYGMGRWEALASLLYRAELALNAARTVLHVETNLGAIPVCGECLDRRDPWWSMEGHPEACAGCGKVTEGRALRVRR